MAGHGRCSMLSPMRITIAIAAGIVSLGACYQEYQGPTTPPPQFGPQPTTVYGPPGGEIDQGYAYSGPSGEVSVGAEYAGGGVEAGIDVSAGATAPITDEQIDSTLQGYGYWVEDDEYGRIWRPDTTVVGVDFTPYETCGTWLWTNYGWTYSCDWDWGWLPFHYGTWGWFDDYWAWVPGYTWSPAWVEWRYGGGYVGWRPLGPRTRDHRTGNSRDDRGPIVRDHRGRRSGDADWRFVGERDFANGRRIRSSLMHAAEGLERTRMVQSPQVRASAPASTRVADIMRNRSYARSQMQPQSRGGSTGTWQQPGRSYQPMQPSAPRSSSQWRQQPSRTYQPYTPAQPSRSYQPQPYTPSQQPYTPAQPSRSYQPQPYTPQSTQPSGGWRQQPSRTYTPMTPSAPQPRPSTFHQPSRTYTPMTPSAPSSNSWRSTPSAPSRTYTPSPSSSSSRGTSSSSSWRSGGSSSHSTSSGGGRRR